MPCNQYSPLVTGALHLGVSFCLICLQEKALSDLVVPMDGDNLYEILFMMTFSYTVSIITCKESILYSYKSISYQHVLLYRVTLLH